MIALYVSPSRTTIRVLSAPKADVVNLCLVNYLFWHVFDEDWSRRTPEPSGRLDSWIEDSWSEQRLGESEENPAKILVSERSCKASVTTDIRVLGTDFHENPKYYVLRLPSSLSLLCPRL